MKPLFKSPQLQKEFERSGFVKVNLLNKSQVETLVNGYQTVAAAHLGINIPYITTSHSNNPELIKQVDSMLQLVMAPELDKILQNYKLLFGNFLVKMPVSGSETNPHQDITFVDEAEFTSVNIWVALQDTTVKNGCMYFMPGSQKLMPTIRPTHDYKWPFEKVLQEIKNHSVYFEAKAGEAFIFQHSVIHGSFANKSETPRVSAVIAAYNADAPLIHYYLPDTKSTTLQKYGMNKEAYLYFVKQQPPAKGVFLKNEQFEFKQLGNAEFETLVKKKGLKLSLTERILNWFYNRSVSNYE